MNACSLIFLLDNAYLAVKDIIFLVDHVRLSFAPKANILQDMEFSV